MSRVASIDALRGFDMIWIVGGDHLVHALHQAMPNSCTAFLARQFEHVPWQGFHFYDLIFPLFLFVVGLVLPFSLNRQRLEGAERGQLYRRIIRRTILLFFLGLVCNGLLDFNLHNLRMAGVLQRIAICYFVTALVVMNTTIRGQMSVTAIILFGYWGLLKLIPVPGIGAGVLTPEGNLAGYIDRHLLPQPYCCYPYGDNEGILSTIPAVATTLLGVLAGHGLRSAMAPKRKAAALAAAGVVSLLAGRLWGHWFLIIKNIWTSSYVLYAAGWSLLLLALFYWLIDVRGRQRWAFFFKVIGMNAITIYVLHSQFDFGWVARIFVYGLIYHLGRWTPVAWELSVIAVEWVFLWYLYRSKIFLRV
jgi:predicted acyltransferase